MNFYLTFFLILFLFIIIWWIILIFVFNKKKKLPKERYDFYNKKIKEIINSNSTSKEQIMDLDKLLHHILKDIWYVWTFWEILKKEPKEIPDLQIIWDYHKLRNKLAHDFDIISEYTLSKKVKNYSLEIQKILRILK